jgi:hypothetical protein
MPEIDIVLVAMLAAFVVRAARGAPVTGRTWSSSSRWS